MPLTWLGRDPEEYARALRQLNTAKRELRGNVDVFEECCRKVSDGINACMQQLSQYRDSWVQWLQNEKEQVSATIETAIQEAETCLGQGFAPSNPLAQVVLGALPKQLRVISFNINLPNMQQLSSKREWITYSNGLQNLCEEFRGPVDRLNITEAMKMDFHRESEECFEKSIEEKPKTIGRHRLPVEWSSIYLKHQEYKIDQRYLVWRRSAEDGNSFYRCFGVLLLEHFCRPDTSVDEFQRIKVTFELSGHRDARIRPKESFLRRMMQIINRLYQSRVSGENTLQLLQYYLSQQAIDTDLISFFRRCTENYIVGNFRDPYLLPFNRKNQVNPIGKEAEELEIRATARCFSVVLHIIYDYNEAVYGPEDPGVYPSISLLYEFRHFSCLIRGDVNYVDGYDFATNTYNPFISGQAIGYEQYPSQLQRAV